MRKTFYGSGNLKDLISVIIPVYNRGKYIHETIESVLNQTHENLELILVDDGSTEYDTFAAMKHYGRIDKRVKVVTQKNKGIGLATKMGVSISSGEYIARCDSDDICERERLERQLMYLKENDYDMIGVYLKSFGSGDEVSKLGIETFNNRPIKNYFDQKVRICTGSTITGGTSFAKASVLKKLDPFHGRYSLSEDMYSYLILHKNGCKIGILEEPLYNYRVHNDNTSLSDRRKEGVYKYFELLFMFLFNDLIYECKNVIIMKRQEEEKLVSHMLNEYFSDLRSKFKFVNEFNFRSFVENEILKYDSDDSVFFVGNLFFREICEILNHRNYVLYKNLFILVDCFWGDEPF